MGLATSKELNELKTNCVLVSDITSNNDNATKQALYGFTNSLMQKVGYSTGLMKTSSGNSVSIPVTYIKTGQSLMMWGEAGDNSNNDTVMVTFCKDVSFIHVPVVNITLTGQTGNSSYSLGLQSMGSPLTDMDESMITTNITTTGFTAQSFGANGSRFTWFASGITK
jgi:hypothetical protein